MYTPSSNDTFTTDGDFIGDLPINEYIPLPHNDIPLHEEHLTPHIKDIEDKE